MGVLPLRELRRTMLTIARRLSIGRSPHAAWRSAVERGELGCRKKSHRLLCGLYEAGRSVSFVGLATRMTAPQLAQR